MSVNDEKAEKYDRQIRLWGAHGQQLIEKASVACLNINAATTETLKNLVLPGKTFFKIFFIIFLTVLYEGIGSYTIVDHRNVDNSDLGCNFFVTIDSIGKSKAQICCELLQELNSDVRGNHLNEVSGNGIRVFLNIGLIDIRIPVVLLTRTFLGLTNLLLF